MTAEMRHGATAEFTRIASGDRPTVWLVGAGPGDPGLLTVRAAALLARADAVFHDALVSRETLDLAPYAELVDVGHRAGDGFPRPDEVAARMAARARLGGLVLRLKGGDPYLFGRGAEEFGALLDAGVAVEVVPGVSSALAGPAAAGIPLTHRDLASTVTIVTGHEQPGQSRVRWRAIAQGADTLVVLMGRSRLKLLTARLVEAGLSPSRPAAVVAAATTPRQRHLVSTLARLADDAEAANLPTPALLVVGEVVRLSELLLSPALPSLALAAGEPARKARG